VRADGGLENYECIVTAAGVARRAVSASFVLLSAAAAAAAADVAAWSIVCASARYKTPPSAQQ